VHSANTAEVPVSLGQTKWPMPPVGLGSVGRIPQSADAPASDELSSRASRLSFKNTIHNFVTSKPTLSAFLVYPVYFFSGVIRRQARSVKS